MDVVAGTGSLETAIQKKILVNTSIVKKSCSKTSQLSFYIEMSHNVQYSH